MIHHISIDADNQMKVATVIAKLMGGLARDNWPFKHVCAAYSGDKYGTMIEVWPRGKVVAIPKSGVGKFEISDNSGPLQYYQSFHTALSVEIEDDEIMEIAKEAGWETAVRTNGAFSVVEVWIENRLLLEVLSPTQAENYQRTMTP